MTNKSSIQVGFAEREITPVEPPPLNGFAGRSGPAAGTHDPLMAFAIHLQNADTGFLLISIDHLGLSRADSAPIRAALAAATDLPESNIWIHCTHTHGAPVPTQAYLEMLTVLLCDAASEAASRGGDFSFASTYVPLTGNWFFNRRALFSGFRPTDTRMSLSVFYRDGVPIGLIYSAACHPACLGPDNNLFTADWPHFVRTSIRRAIGWEIPVILLQGTSADINTGYSPGVSVLEREVPTRSYEHAESLGAAVAGAILGALKTLEPKSVSRLEVVRSFTFVSYRGRENGDNDEKRRRLVESFLRDADGLCSRDLADAARIELVFIGYSEAIASQNRGNEGSDYSLEANVAVLDDTVILGFPGEFFVSDGIAMKNELPGKIVHCASMTNDYQGYFPPARAFPEGGYEPMVAAFAPDSSARYLGALAELAKSRAEG